MARKRAIGSLAAELVAKAREAAICAIRVFNDPGLSFRSENFIVLMVIAWTYLLHGYYRQKRIEYRYFEQKGKNRKFDRTKRGAFKYWELERCLNDSKSPLDKDTANNLRFLIGLRHEIEHQMTRCLDQYLSGRYQAAAMNFNHYIKSLFGARYAIDAQLGYCIQFLELSEDQFNVDASPKGIGKAVRDFIASFDGALSEDEFNSPRFAYRLLFTKKLVNRPGQADKVVEFIDPKSELAQTIGKEYWVRKEVERPKFTPKHVVAEVRKAGFAKFRVQKEHVELWKSENAKDPGKGYGVSVEGSWYWYQSWIDRCIELCQAAGDKYR